MTKAAYRAGRDQAATAENVELLTGQRGNKLDKAVTLRELTALGLATLRPGAGGSFTPGKNPDLFPTGTYDKPHAPVNVQANGAFHTVVIDWDGPNYRGHAHAEVWRAETDSLPAATLVGTTSANVFSDAIGKGATFYYWVRFVNGKDDAGPFNANGVKAETSRDVQDILDELQGQIDESHLAKELLDPIKKVPQLSMDVEAIKPKLEGVDVSIGSIQNKIPSLEGELASLNQKQQESEALLKDAQDQLGNASIDIGLVQDRLNDKIDKYKGDFDSFRDAVFEVDPENGNITMDAVNAVREELRTSITEVHQSLDAVSGQITSKADNVTVDSQGQRITEAEQRINGLDASLSQTVTKGEFTEEQKKVTQIGQELNATKGELAQKATQQEVDEQGERLANAESKLTVHTDELSSQAQRIDGLQATVNRGDEELDARITELARVTADADGVTAQRVSGLEVRTSEAEGKISVLEEIIESEGGITAGRFDEIQAEIELAKDKADGAGDAGQAAIDAALAGDERDRDNRTAFGAIRTQQQVIVNEQAAQAKRITDIDVKFEGKDADTQARITGVEEAFADADSALAQRQDNMESSIDLGGKTDVEGALAGDERDRENRKARGKIITQQQTLANAHEALARDVTQLTADYEADSADLHSQITEERLARSTADEALAQKTSVLEAQIEGVDQSLSASIAEVAKASADADSAMTEKLSQQQSAMETADAELSGRINEEATTRADAVESLASQIQQVTADFQKGDDSLSGQITTESEARATADGALGKRIDTVAAQAGELESAVQTQSQAIADLENGAQAMWSVKAQAGDIKAGIGLVAKSDGTSQVMVSASQFFVFNPNSPNATAPLFAIDNGQTVIAEAIIRKATIQIIQSEKITADYVKAGVSMSAPAISGGSIDMGNAFLSGGAAGFGKGGPYGGWSWTWHTIIYADGSLYTDRLFASNGSFTGTVNANAGTFQNVTIEETCNVKGTVYANKIVGDVLSAKVVSANSTDSAGSGHVVASASVKGSRTHAANLYCLGVTVEVYASGGYRPGGNDQDVPATISGRLVLTNSAGGIIATAPFKVRSGSNISIAAASQSITIQGGFDAGTGAASISCAVIIDSQSASYGGSAGVRVPAQSIAFCLLPSGSQFN
ncbi:phage tail tip protein [Aeromonas caviae]